MKVSVIVLAVCTAMCTIAMASTVRAQPALQKKITLSLNKAPLDEAFTRLEHAAGMPVLMVGEIAERKITLQASNETVEKVLKKMLTPAGLTYQVMNNTIVVKKAPPVPKPGKITGKVVDEKNQPLPGATIKVLKTGQAIVSNVDGTYQLSLQPGSYTLEVSYVSYQTKHISEVTVSEGRNTPLDIAMVPAANQLEAVVIKSSYSRSSTEGLYARQKNNAAMTDGISAEQIARTPDKNIGETLKRINGVNVLDAKYVVVRGLGERYNSAVLNGQSMPSTELNRKQFSFDIIPTNIVDQITVYKSITADKSAEFAGGLIEVETKTVPTENFLNITIGSSYNDNTTGKVFRGMNIGNSAFLGNVPDDRKLFGRTDWKNTTDAANYYASKNSDPNLFSNNWKVAKYQAPVSPNFQAAWGHVNNFKNNDQLGYMASVSYRNTWQNFDVLSGRNGYTGGEDNKDALFGYTGNRYAMTTNLGGIAGVGYTGQTFKVSLQGTALRTYDQQLMLGVGSKDTKGRSFGYYDWTTQTDMMQTQLRAEKTFGSKGMKLNALVSYLVLDRQKPDNHQMDAEYVGNGSVDDPLNPDADFGLKTAESENSNGVLRSWNRSFEKNLSWNLDLSVRLSFKWKGINFKNTLKTGYAGWYKDRLFWVLNTGSGNFGKNNFQPISTYFDPAIHPGAGITFSQFGDDFNVAVPLHAGYAMFDSKIGNHIRIMAGLRGESFNANRANTRLDNFIRDQRKMRTDNTDYSELYAVEKKLNWFPSAAVTYSLTSQMNLRLSYAKSIIRPDLRDVSYFKEYDFELGGIYWSNRPIQATKIHNVDFRYEWYPSVGEVLSFSLFYKKLNHPMEVYKTQDRTFELMNDKSAKNKGFEIEARKSLRFIDIPVIRNLTLYGNFSRLFAKVTPMNIFYNNALPGREGKLIPIEVAEPEVERPQAGASNYTYNAAAYFDTKHFSLSLSYNYITNRVFVASYKLGNSLFETPLPSLDGQLAYRFGKANKAEVKLNFSNLLGKVSRVYGKREGALANTLLYEKGDFLNYQATPGRTYGLSFNYSF